MCASLAGLAKTKTMQAVRQAGQELAAFNSPNMSGQDQDHVVRVYWYVLALVSAGHVY